MTGQPPTDPVGAHALLTNHGDRFTLHVEAGGVVDEHTFRLVDLAEDESPRDAAVKHIAELGWRVAGDGTWFVSAFVGPDANRTWTNLVPAGTGGLR